jgi:uncharacterized membrane protein YoaK (UPF0700 family)
MLIKLGDERNDVVDRRLACILAAIAGAVNTVAFHAVGFFSANMTGNVSALSDHLALGEWAVGAFYLTIVACFIAGAAVSAILVNAGRRRQIRGVYAFCIIGEAVLMAVLAGLGLWLAPDQSGPVLVLGLSFLMGLQNAVTTQISDARVRTTHVSGMATDIGIELANLLDAARGLMTVEEVPRNRSKLQLHSQTVLSFLLGGAVGVLVYQIAKGLLLVLAAALLLTIGVHGLLKARRIAVAGQLPA